MAEKSWSHYYPYLDPNVEVDVVRAREIFGKGHVFGPDELAHLNVPQDAIKRNGRKKLSLERYALANDHTRRVLYFGYPVTIQQLAKQHGDLFTKFNSSILRDPGIASYPKTRIGWTLMNMPQKFWDAETIQVQFNTVCQYRNFRRGFKIAEAVDVIFVALIMFLTTGARLIPPGITVRTGTFDNLFSYDKSVGIGMDEDNKFVAEFVDDESNARNLTVLGRKLLFK